jgi:hypothetical protein
MKLEEDEETISLLSKDEEIENDVEEDEVGVDSVKSIFIVLGSFLNHIFSYGFAFSVGVLVVPFTEQFNKDRGTVSWFASILTSGKK